MNEAPGDAPTRSTIPLGQPLLHVVEEDAPEVRRVSVSPDDRFLVTALAGGYAFHVYDLQDPSEGPHARLEVKHFAMHGVFSAKVDPSEPNARLLACCIGAPGNTVELFKFDIANGKFEHSGTLLGHQGPVYMGLWESSGNYFWTGSNDGTLRCYDIASHKSVLVLDMRSVFVDRAPCVHSFAFSPDSSLLAVRMSNRSLVLADVRKSNNAMESMVVDEDSLRVLDLKPVVVVHSAAQSAAVMSYALSACGNFVIVQIEGDVLVLCDRHGSEICRMPTKYLGGKDPGSTWAVSDLLFAPLMPHLLISGNGCVMNVANVIKARTPLSDEDTIARLPVISREHESVRRVCYISPGSTYCVLWSSRMKLVQVYCCPSLLSCLDGCVAFAQGLSSPESPISTVLGGNALFDRNVLGVVFSFLSGSSFGDSDS